METGAVDRGLDREAVCDRGVEGLYDQRRGNGTSKTERFDCMLVRVLTRTPEELQQTQPIRAPGPPPAKTPNASQITSHFSTLRRYGIPVLTQTEGH
jgi:hypothetical protein